MSNYFNIWGYWKDDETPFEGYIVKETEDVNPKEDENIFFYGLSESDIIQAIKDGKNTALDFVITDYEKHKP